MHDFSRRRLFRLAIFWAAALLLLCAQGYGEEAEQTEIKTAVETFLRSYQQEAMLCTETDQRFCTVSDPYFPLPEEAARQTFPLSHGTATLSQLQDNIRFVEKKADFYAAMRQLQDIYREELHLSYTYQSLTLEEGAAHVSLTETASFRYLDSDWPSVYETLYRVDLVKLNGRWLVADVTDGSRFDALYKSDPDFDVSAALAELAANLQAEGCTVHNPCTPAVGSAIPYLGANAAAYAYTYSRLQPDTPRAGFYNPQFERFDNHGGDCMNFASQCMWAGFGGSQEASALSGHALPMDTGGSARWAAWSAGADDGTTSWISCQNFRKYLTGSCDALGSGGSNGSDDMGMYATVMDVTAGAPLSGVTAQELVGAVAHVEGSGGPYAHAIVLTAATGVRRSQIWFCAHTRDITHVKLGDCYTGPMKVYIPRYLRTGSAQAPSLQVMRLAPVAAGSTQALLCRAGREQYRMSIAVTAPDGTPSLLTTAEYSDVCSFDCLFSQEGVYQVTCSAQAVEGGETVHTTFSVRCFPAGDALAAGAEEPLPEGSSEMPEWLRPMDDEE